mmetsp:Transcript_6639/g.14135  ORF Transcript_6639/g.14135 Transcript_6639/m.14135 type:complete len:354 (+) Transcript_6639:231-1292(+)
MPCPVTTSSFMSQQTYNPLLVVLLGRTEVVHGHEVRNGRRSLYTGIGLGGSLYDIQLGLVVQIQIDAGLGNLERQNVVVGSPVSTNGVPAVCVHQRPLHALSAEFGSCREEHIFLVGRMAQGVVNHALLVVEFFLSLVDGIQMLRVLGLEQAFQNIGSEWDQKSQQEGIDVSDHCVLSNGPDRYRAGKLDKGPGLNGPPFYIPHDGNLGALVLVDPAKEQSLPDFVSVEGTHSQVQQQSKETADRDPRNDGKGAKGDKHEQCLSQCRPALFFAVGDDFAHDTVLVGFVFSRTEGPAMKRGLGDESVARGQSQNGAGEKGNAQDKEIPVVGWWFLQVKFRRLRQDAGNVVIDDK